jgi:hypothetical protein
MNFTSPLWGVEKLSMNQAKELIAQAWPCKVKDAKAWLNDRVRCDLVEVFYEDVDIELGEVFLNDTGAIKISSNGVKRATAVEMAFDDGSRSFFIYTARLKEALEQETPNDAEMPASVEEIQASDSVAVDKPVPRQSGAAVNETPSERTTRLKARRDELMRQGKRGWREVIAAEEGISTRMVSSVINRSSGAFKPTPNRPFG